MLFSIAIQFTNKDIHTFNINALSFKHANLKIERYEFLNIGKNIKRTQVSSNGSSFFCASYPLIKISKYKLSGYPIVTTVKNVNQFDIL